MSNLPLVVAVVGPTCSGKTGLAIKLAQHLKGEIVACDSRTIYKYMDIGTAKPTADECEAARHHMIDLVEPDQVYTVSQYQKQGETLLAELVEKKITPIVCGGTGFYVRALLEGLQMPEVAPQQALRAELNSLADSRGTEHLRGILSELDAVSAKKIGPNDRFRLIRAIEVSQVLGLPFSQAQSRKAVPYNIVWLGLTANRRELLKERIVERFDQQLADGLVAEVENLYKKYGATQALLNTVAYKEYIQYLRGEFTVEQAREESIKHSVALARRQLIWFRANRDMHWLAIDQYVKNELLDQCKNIISSKLAQQK